MSLTGQGYDAERVREKCWFYKLVNQGLFVAQINNDYSTCLSDCLTAFMVSIMSIMEYISLLTIFQIAAHMETLAWQKEDEKWRTGLQESLYADRRVVMEEFAAPNFVERVTESRPSDNQNDIRTISTMMQGVRKWYKR